LEFRRVLFRSPATAIQIRNAVWLVFDLIILYTILKYGRKYFTGTLHKYFAPIIFGGILLAGLVIYFIVNEYYIRNLWGVQVGGTTPEFLRQTRPGAVDVTGFGLNLVGSVLFVFLLGRRGNLDGQSFLLAFTKWLCTLSIYIFIFAGVIQTPLVNTLYAAIFVFDIYD